LPQAAKRALRRALVDRREAVPEHLALVVADGLGERPHGVADVDQVAAQQVRVAQGGVGADARVRSPRHTAVNMPPGPGGSTVVGPAGTATGTASSGRRCLPAMGVTPVSSLRALREQQALHPGVGAGGGHGDQLTQSNR
jgi:hypothetical protein